MKRHLSRALVLERAPLPERLPVRTDAPWCAVCGCTLPAHWAGCPERSAA